MFKAVLKKNRDGSKGSKKDSGDVHSHSTQSRFPPEGNPPPQGPCNLHPNLPDDVFRLSLAKGVSMSLPSSPLLPRQSYMMPLRSSKRSPGPSRKPKYVESPRIPSDAIASALRKVADNKDSKQHAPGRPWSPHTSHLFLPVLIMLSLLKLWAN